MFPFQCVGSENAAFSFISDMKEERIRNFRQVHQQSYITPLFVFFTKTMMNMSLSQPTQFNNILSKMHFLQFLNGQEVYSRYSDFPTCQIGLTCSLSEIILEGSKTKNKERKKKKCQK